MIDQKSILLKLDRVIIFSRQKGVLSIADERGMTVDKAKLFSHAVDSFLSEPKKAQRCRRNPFSPLKSF